MGNYNPKGEESVRFNLKPETEETKKEFEEAYKRHSKNTLIKRIIGIALAGCVTVGSVGTLAYKNYKSNHPFDGELMNITNTDEYKELKKEWKNPAFKTIGGMLTTPQQLKDDLEGYRGTDDWDLLSIPGLIGVDEDIYMIYLLYGKSGVVTSMYKYHVGKDVIDNFKLMRNASAQIDDDDYFNYVYLIKHVIENYKGELMVQNYGSLGLQNELLEVDENQATCYYINNDDVKPVFIKKTGTLPDFALFAIRLDGMVKGGRIVKNVIRDATTEELGPLEFIGTQFGLDYINYSNEYTK